MKQTKTQLGGGGYCYIVCLFIDLYDIIIMYCIVYYNYNIFPLIYNNYSYYIYIYIERNTIHQECTIYTSDK